MSDTILSSVGRGIDRQNNYQLRIKKNVETMEHHYNREVRSL